MASNPPPTDPWLGPTSPVSPQRPAILIEVLRATSSATGGAFSYQALPNVVCTDVVWPLGPRPKVAALRYVFDGYTQGVPQSVEQAMSTAYTGPGVINVGDRIVVRATRPDGTRVPLFDGFPQQFGMNLAGDVEEASIVCVGVEYRCTDLPVGGAIYRDASQVQSTAESAQFATDLVARCNRGGMANATDAGYDFDPSPGGSTDAKYPVFLDAEVCRDRQIGRLWTLPMLCRYLIFANNEDEQYVTNPDGGVLDALLVSREPVAGAIYNPSDSSTYTAKPIQISDRPLTGRDWPSLIDSVIRDKGFATSFDLASDDNGNPETTLRVFLINSGTVKDVYLATRGSGFNPETTNVGAAEASRSLEPLVNSVVVEGSPLRFEVSIILLPAFPSQASDSANTSALDAFELNNNIAEQDAYRLFVLNEAGDGYYLPNSTAQVLTPPSLDAIFGPGNYTPRRRRALPELISTEDATNDGPPLRPRLSIATNCTQTTPGVWDGQSGTWQDVESGFEWTRDRVGVRLTCPNPNGWNIGPSDATNAPFPSGIVKVVECLGNPSKTNPAFQLRATIVLEGDQVLKGTADLSGWSISTTKILRTVDARDRYRKDVVQANTEINPTSDPQTHRDDTDAAQAEADALREAMENGVFGGEITIPRFTLYYQIGDTIRSIAGRGLPFRLDGGGSQNTPVYPVVEEIHWELGDGQKTTLKLADEAGFAKKGKRGGRRR